MFVSSENPTPCTTTDPELWFSKLSNERALAKKLCLGCPLRDPCLQSALDYEELSGESLAGIFGALSQQDRQRLAEANR